MKLIIKKRKSIIFTVLILAGVLSYIFSRSSCAGGLVPCTDDCNLCYLLVGISNVFLYLAGSLLMAAVLLGIVIGGMVFIVSGLFPQALNFAKLAFSVSLKALIIALCGWLAINSIMNIVGYKHPLGGKWYKFECSTGGTTCTSSNKTLQSIKIKCSKDTSSTTSSTSTDGSGFYVALDTLTEDGSGKTQQLKAIGTYSCDGTTSEEDITSQVEWKASDETQVKVAKGLVAAVSTSLGSSSESVPYVEAKFQEKNSNQAKVYINSCPNTTASIDANDKFSLQFDNLLIPKAHAEPNSSFNSSKETGCTSCGQANTCSWVAGSKNTDLKYVLIIMRSDNFKANLCNYVSDSWGDGKNTWQSFHKIAHEFADGINYITNTQLLNNDIAVYVSSVVGGSDPNCPKATVEQIYGFVQNGKGVDANASFSKGSANYCFTCGEAEYNKGVRSYDRLFAHEQIGHALAILEDEYVLTSSSPNDFEFGEGYNCTSDSDCTKWGNKNDACEQGCRYTNAFWRSSENSLMKDHWSATGFGTLNSYLIEETIKYGKPNDIVTDGNHPLKENLVIPEY